MEPEPVEQKLFLGVGAKIDNFPAVGSTAPELNFVFLFFFNQNFFAYRYLRIQYCILERKKIRL